MFYFLNSKKLGEGQLTTTRNTYWGSLFVNLQNHLKEQSDIYINMVIKEPYFHYTPIGNYESIQKAHPYKAHICLQGYYQSPLYFDKYKKYLFKFIGLSSCQEKIIKQEKITTNNIYISMHFRLGDYKKYINTHPILHESYYINSLTYILEKQQDTHNIIILYFCENDDIMDVENKIQIIKDKFPNLQFKRAPQHLLDWEQLMLMSVCQHNIIANSTFSWWGAYMKKDTSETQLVCYPNVWFGPYLKKNDTRTLFPSNWIKIK
jgi:hypothetical protein